jgi:hypothetical protein
MNCQPAAHVKVAGHKEMRQPGSGWEKLKRADKALDTYVEAAICVPIIICGIALLTGGKYIPLGVLVVGVGVFWLYNTLKKLGWIRGLRG